MPQDTATAAPRDSHSPTRWQALNAFSDGQDNGLRAWLNVLDASIAALERTAWQGRKLAGQAIQAWRLVESGASDLATEYQLLSAEAKRWPARLKRLSKTGWMLTRLTASYRLWGTRSAFLPAHRQAGALATLHRRNARRFAETSLEQGGAFLKIGQLLSTRPDLLPAPWVEELTALQDNARPESPAQMRAVLEEEFGLPVEVLFREFDDEPLAAASIGQVHRAVLEDGREVAVKIQRPGLPDIIELDMTLMRLFIDSISHLLPPTDLPTILDEIERSVRSELDYRAEARAMRKVGVTLKDVTGVRVPDTVDALCSKRVLTTTFVHGEKFTHVLDRHRAAGNNAAIADILSRLLDAWLHQILVGGCFHADPHPGNILLAGDGDLVLLDFGSTAHLPEPFRQGYFRVLQASIVGDSTLIADTLLQLGFGTRSGRPDTLLAFADAMLAQLREAALQGDIHFAWPTPEQMLTRARDLLAQAEADPVDKLPAEFIMLARVFGSLGGLFLHYHPPLDMAARLLPLLTREDILPVNATAPTGFWRRLM